MNKAYNNQVLQTVLSFWFGNVSETDPFEMNSIQMQRWYGKNPSIDAEIKETYENLYLALLGMKGSDAWYGLTTQDLLAALIALDQFPRNMYRDTPSMYEADTLGLELASLLEGRPDFAKLDLFKQLFGLLPFMHAEDLSAQTLMLHYFEGFPKEDAKRGSPNADFFENALNFANRHHEIIKLFGRFPHRNDILGRVSTSREIEFLNQPDSGF